MDSNYTAYVGFGLFILSELMPFIKKTKGNGFIHSLICILNGSECVIGKIKEVAENAVKEEENVDNEKV